MQKLHRKDLWTKDLLFKVIPCKGKPGDPFQTAAGKAGPENGCHVPAS